MAKIHLKRLADSLGIKENEVSGHNYQKIMTHVLANQSINIANQITKINKDGWNKALEKITPKGKPYVIPDISDVLPQRSVFVRKSADRGKLLIDTLRSSLTDALRTSLLTYTEKGEPAYIIPKGKAKGRINEVMIRDFEQQITSVFENYTKKHPKFGVPVNIHAIAVTEMRSTINETKTQYITKLKEKNPDLIITKKWIHNPSLSHEPRRGHMEVARRRPIPINEKFEVPRWKKLKGKLVRIGITKMMHPHDPTAPPDQVITCNCDVDYITRWKK